MNLKSRWLGYFGLPLVFQTDNGLEFKNQLIKDTLMNWDGSCKIVYGRPRHPQSQGLVEQANGTLENMIAAIMEQFKTKKWAEYLPLVMYNLNTSKSSTTKFMPFEVTFNKMPNVGSKVEYLIVDKEGNEVPDSNFLNEQVASEVVESRAVAESEEINNEIVESEAVDDHLVLKNMIEDKRKQLNENKTKNAEKMIKKHDHKRNKKTTEFKVNDKVSVKIPRIDRGGVDFPRLPGIVSKIFDHQKKFYEILTEYGILNDKYRASDLESFSGLVNVDLLDYENGKYTQISLKSAAGVQNARTGSTELVNTICNCQGLCKSDNRCKCFKIGKKFTSHCHLKTKLKKKM